MSNSSLRWVLQCYGLPAVYVALRNPFRTTTKLDEAFKYGTPAMAFGAAQKAHRDARPGSISMPIFRIVRVRETVPVTPEWEVCPE